MEDNKVLEKDYTVEETDAHILENENALLDGLLAAAEYASNEIRTIQIVREGKHYFSFGIHPLPEDRIFEIRKKYTTYTKNRRAGIKVGEDLDVSKFRSSMIYNSTIPEDQEKLWDNKRLWEGLRKQGKYIVNALDVIDAVLLPGEKDRIMDELDKLGGYDEDSPKEMEEKIESAKN